MADSRIRYARNGSVSLAYRVFGAGETTLVWSTGWASNLDWYDDPTSSYAIAMQMLSVNHSHFSGPGDVLAGQHRDF